MNAIIVWLVYLLLAFLIAPLLFRARFGRWPFAYALPPRDAYSWVDILFAAALAGYTWALLTGERPRPVSIPGGLGVFGAGAALQAWAIVTMGRHWRMGQNRKDRTVEYVRHGPFRLIKHPIYISLFIIAIGMALLTGFDGRAFFLVIATASYFGVQGKAETLHWRQRNSW